MPITLQHSEESLCLAHIHAIAAIAGATLGRDEFDYGVDGHFRSLVNHRGRRVPSGYALDFQAKATTDWKLTDGCIVYGLEAKTYNDMVGRSDSATTLILILLCLPSDQELWHTPTAEETVLRHCCYWHKLHGEPTDNEYTKTIYIPRSQLLTPATLNELLALEKIRRSGQPS